MSNVKSIFKSKNESFALGVRELLLADGARVTSSNMMGNVLMVDVLVSSKDHLYRFSEMGKKIGMFKNPEINLNTRKNLYEFTSDVSAC